MPWVTRIIPILMRVISRGGRIGAKRGVGDIGKNLPKVLDKARRADGWRSSALSTFCNTVGLIASAMTIAMGFDWNGVKGDAADAAKRRCDKASEDCKKQDKHSADGAQSVGECGKKVDEVLEDCEKQAEDMAEQTDGILAQCEALVDDPEVGTEAAKVAQQVCGSLVDCTGQLYDARNTCIEQCLDQAACDTESAVVASPPQPPAVVSDAGATSVACAQMGGSIGGGVAVGLAIEPCATQSCATQLPSTASADLAAGLSAGVVIGAAGAASIAGIAEGVASSLLDLEVCPEPESVCPEPESKDCEPEPAPEPAPAPQNTPEPPPPATPEPPPPAAPEPPPPAEKLQHLGIEIPEPAPAPEPEPEPAPVQESASASPEAPESLEPEEPVGAVQSPTAGEWS